jgi:hypothetical protein
MGALMVAFVVVLVGLVFLVPIVLKGINRMLGRKEKPPLIYVDSYRRGGRLQSESG